MSSAYWQTNRQREQFDCGSNLRSRIAAYSETWTARCYSGGIPDEVPRKLQKSNRAPSWRAVALAILENDHNLYSLGFGLRETAFSNELWRANKQREKREMDVATTQQQEATDGNPYEAIKVIEAWGLSYCLGRTIEYIAERRGTVEELEKAAQYLAREIENRRRAPKTARIPRRSV